MNRVAGLTQVFMDAGVMKPTGQISEGIFSEWKTGVARLSQDKVTHADKATIINAVRTCAELKHFMAARDREMPPELDLREGPVRAFNSWHWLSRQGQLNWPLEGIQSAPTAGSRKQKRSQAVVVEPPMLCYVEDIIEDFFGLNNSNWRRLLGCWLVGRGCSCHQKWPRELAFVLALKECPSSFEMFKMRPGTSFQAMWGRLKG